MLFEYLWWRISICPKDNSNVSITILGMETLPLKFKLMWYGFNFCLVSPRFRFPIKPFFNHLSFSAIPKFNSLCHRHEHKIDQQNLIIIYLAHLQSRRPQALLRRFNFNLGAWCDDISVLLRSVSRLGAEHIVRVAAIFTVLRKFDGNCGASRTI